MHPLVKCRPADGDVRPDGPTTPAAAQPCPLWHTLPPLLCHSPLCGCPAALPLCTGPRQATAADPCESLLKASLPKPVLEEGRCMGETVSGAVAHGKADGGRYGRSRNIWTAVEHERGRSVVGQTLRPERRGSHHLYQHWPAPSPIPPFPSLPSPTSSTHRSTTIPQPPQGNPKGRSPWGALSPTPTLPRPALGKGMQGYPSG